MLKLPDHNTEPPFRKYYLKFKPVV